MNREEFQRGEIKFLGGLIDQVVKMYPETRDFLDDAIAERIEKNKGIEKELDSPESMRENVAKEIRRILGK